MQVRRRRDISFPMYRASSDITLPRFQGWSITAINLLNEGSQSECNIRLGNSRGILSKCNYLGRTKYWGVRDLDYTPLWHYHLEQIKQTCTVSG